MKKKLFIIGILVALVGSGAFAQLVIGATGALHMDDKLSGSEIKARFEDGEGIFYGPFVEIIMGHLGLGVAGNFSFYTNDFGTATTYNMMDYDINGYASFHLFKGRSLLDPFGEIGGGYIATDFADSEDQDLYNPYVDSPLYASYYWFAAIGFGVNLGPIGIFGKFAYNYPISKSVEGEWDPAKASSGYRSGTTTINPYGYDGVLFPDGYLPKYRFTIGAKLIL